MILTTAADGTPMCNNILEVFGAPLTKQLHCGRLAPAVLMGTVTPGARATILLAPGTNLSGPVLRLTNPVNENRNMNQVVSSLDVRVGAHTG